MLPENWVISKKKGHHLSPVTSYALFFYQIDCMDVKNVKDAATQ